MQRSTCWTLPNWHAAAPAERRPADLRRGAAIARRFPMLKPLVILTMLTGPALADPPAPSIRVELQLRVGADTRSHIMAVTDNSCGRVEDKAPDHTDEIKACAHAQGADIVLQLDWTTRGDKTEYKNQSSIVVAHGGSVELGKPGTRLLVRVI